MPGILDQIVDVKRHEVERLKAETPQSDLERRIETQTPALNLAGALMGDRVSALEATVRDLQSQIDSLPTPAPPTIVTVVPTPSPTPIVIPTPTPRVTPTEGVPSALQTGTVSTGGGVLNVRTGPSLSEEILETLSDGSVISLTGEQVSGTTYDWLELTNGGWVATEFVTLDE